MPSSNPFKKLLSSGKIYSSRDPYGNEWLTVARKGKSGWKETDLTVDEYIERIEATEEIFEMLQSEDADKERLIELQEEVFRRPTSTSKK